MKKVPVAMTAATQPAPQIRHTRLGPGESTPIPRTARPTKKRLPRAAPSVPFQARSGRLATGIRPPYFKLNVTFAYQKLLNSPARTQGIAASTTTASPAAAKEALF